MHGLFCSPFVSSSLSACECGLLGVPATASRGPPAAAWPASCSFAYPIPQSSTLLGPPAATLCLSPPLLPVWVNVSSVSPWLSDFHTVQLSVSSGCFLFLNCCRPSFGCARRHSVSTYTSILARSLYFLCIGVLGSLGCLPRSGITESTKIWKQTK